MEANYVGSIECVKICALERTGTVLAQLNTKIK
jgi:hypothetical protein